MIKRGDIIQAKLVEAIDADHWIVSFSGHLIQVRNTTDLEFQEGRQLLLEVTQIRPIELKVRQTQQQRRRFIA